MSFDELVDLAQAVQPPVSATEATGLKPAGEARFSPDALYRIAGRAGLWRARRDGEGVRLSLVFGADEVPVDGMAWRAACESGRIRQVG